MPPKINAIHIEINKFIEALKQRGINNHLLWNFENVLNIGIKAKLIAATDIPQIFEQVKKAFDLDSKINIPHTLTQLYYIRASGKPLLNESTFNKVVNAYSTKNDAWIDQINECSVNYHRLKGQHFAYKSDNPQIDPRQEETEYCKLLTLFSPPSKSAKEITVEKTPGCSV